MCYTPLANAAPGLGLVYWLNTHRDKQAASRRADDLITSSRCLQHRLCDVNASTHAYTPTPHKARVPSARAIGNTSRTMADKANPLMFSGNAADMLKQYGQAVPDSA